MAVPAVKSSVQYFRVRSAVSSVTGAIQSTRYRAIFDGCPYNIAFDKTANTFQVASETNGGNSCAASFSNVGTAVPFAASAVGLNQNFTLQFKPSGYVQATTGTTTFTLTYGSTTKTVTVSTYGNINVTP
jgi:Tfp pilus assembly protein FimT